MGKNRCATPTHFVYDRFSATPASQISLFSNLFSLFIRATVYGTLSPSLTSLKLQIWTLLPSFSALSTFRVYLLMYLWRRLFKSALTLSIVRNTLLHLFHGKSSSNLWIWLLLLFEFSFNDIMHCQIDVVAMGSPLGPSLANIFVGYYESKLFQTTSKPEMYYRYMDDTFVVFSNKYESNLFLDSLNSLHPSLRFTFEKESNLALPFLDVLVEKSPFKFITSIYRKPTFTSQYIRWNSFNPRKRKTNLILTITHRALAIRSPERLPSEIL